MSKTRIEWTGNIQVHHPVKEAVVIPFPKPTWQELLDMAAANHWSEAAA